jgi:hypothetical protein
MHTGYDLFHIVHPDMALSNRQQSYYWMLQAGDAGQKR